MAYFSMLMLHHWSIQSLHVKSHWKHMQFIQSIYSYNAFHPMIQTMKSKLKFMMSMSRTFKITLQPFITFNKYFVDWFLWNDLRITMNFDFFLHYKKNHIRLWGASFNSPNIVTEITFFTTRLSQCFDTTHPFGHWCCLTSC